MEKLFVVAVIFIILLIGTCTTTKWVASEPIFEYSNGDRVGVLRKLSKKGFMCKTWEGELMLNADMGSVKLDTFNFSIMDEELANEIKDHIGKKMRLSYIEYFISPYKSGDSSYKIVAYELIE
jgi:hypothetical protein